jgi:hypothetical protein
LDSDPSHRSGNCRILHEINRTKALTTHDGGKIKHLIRKTSKKHNGKTKIENTKWHKEENKRTKFQNIDMGKTIAILLEQYNKIINHFK